MRPITHPMLLWMVSAQYGRPWSSQDHQGWGRSIWPEKTRVLQEGMIVAQLTLFLEARPWGCGLWLLSPLYEERAGLKLKPRNRHELEEDNNRFYVTNYADFMWPPGCTYYVIWSRVILEHTLSIGQFTKHSKFLTHSCSVPWIFYKWLQPAESFRNSIDLFSLVYLGGPEVEQMRQLLCFLLWFFSVKDQREFWVVFILHPTWHYQYPFLPLNLDLASNIDLLHSKNEYCKALQLPSFKHCRGDFPSWSTQADCSRHAPRSSFTPAHAPPSGLSS